jgi:hypothetical protein
LIPQHFTVKANGTYDKNNNGYHNSYYNRSIGALFDYNWYFFNLLFNRFHIFNGSWLNRRSLIYDDCFFLILFFRLLLRIKHNRLWFWLRLLLFWLWLLVFGLRLRIFFFFRRLRLGLRFRFRLLRLRLRLWCRLRRWFRFWFRLSIGWWRFKSACIHPTLYFNSAIPKYSRLILKPYFLRFFDIFYL